MKKIILPFLMFCLLSSALLSQSWVQQTSPTTNNLFSAWAVNQNVCWISGATNTVLRTTNGGTTWAMANSGVVGGLYSICAIDANTCYVGADDGTLYKTTNGGANWTFTIFSPTAVFINVIHFFNANTGFVQSDPPSGGGQWRYYITTNGGANWTLGANTPNAASGEAGWNNSYMAIDTGHIWWGTNVSKIYKGSLMGPFTSAPTTVNYSFGVAFNDANTGVAAFSQGGTVSSPTATTVNGGSTWTPSGFTPTGIAFALKSVPGTGYMWMGTANFIYRSTNSGSSWTSQLTMPASTACYALSMVNVNLGWAGTQGGRIYKYTDFIGIDPNNNSVPKVYSIEQNYPNPFNPATTIKYGLPNASFVTLKIYDALGNEVKTVVNENQTPGNYIENIDMSSYASGIYYYSLTAGDFKETKKMILVK